MPHFFVARSVGCLKLSLSIHRVHAPVGRTVPAALAGAARTARSPALCAVAQLGQIHCSSQVEALQLVELYK